MYDITLFDVVLVDDEISLTIKSKTGQEIETVLIVR